MDPTGWTGVWRRGRDLYTRNAVPGRRTYGETIAHDGGIEYRRWDPFRSKLAAYLDKGPGDDLFAGVRSVLYLGGGHGTTVSHVSDALPAATIFVVEKSPLAFAPLLALARERTNLFPLLADAQLPERYTADVGVVDLLYQDVAQRAQARIFLENARACLRRDGRGLLMLKVRSVTQSRPAGEVVREARRTLDAGGLPIRSAVDLAPFSRQHTALRVGR